MKKMLKMLLAMLALSMVLAGCGSAPSGDGGSETGGGTAANEPQYGGTYIMASVGEPLSFNPNLKADDYALPGIYNMFNRLIKSTLDNSIQPDLAYKWEFSEDQKQLTFFLREGVKWHDGEDFNSEDVVWTFEKILAGDAYQSGTLANVESVVANGDYEVTFNLKGPDASILSVLSWLGVWIMPEHIYNDGTDWQQHPANMNPIGTGPFKFVKYEAGSSITMEAFEDYWDGRPYIDTLIVSIIPDAQTMFQAYLNGEIDDIQGNTPKTNIADFVGDPNYNTYDHVGSSRTYLSFAMNDPETPVSDLRIRQAINMAIDRQGVVDKAEKGFGSAAEYYVAAIFPDYEDDNYKIPARDVEAAKALIEDAGYTLNEEGFYFDLLFTIFDSGSFKDVAYVIQDNLKEIGINVELEVLEMGTWMQRVITDYDFEMSMCSGGQGPDISAVRNRCHSKGSLNLSRYNNPELDAALDNGVAVSGVDARKPFYSEAQRILSEDLPMVIVDDYQITYPVKGYIHNHPYEYEQASQFSSQMMHKVWIDQDAQANFQ